MPTKASPIGGRLRLFERQFVFSGIRDLLSQCMGWNRPFTFDRVVRLVLILAMLAAGVWVLHQLRAALLPFAIGVLLAYLLSPLVNFFQVKLRLKNRALSVFTVLFLVFLVFGGMIAALMPVLVNQTEAMYALVRRFVEDGEWSSADLPQALQDQIREFLSDDAVMQWLDPNTISQAAQAILPRLWGVVSDSYSALMGLLGVVIVLLYVVFLLLDYKRLSVEWKDYLPARHGSWVEEVGRDFGQAMGVYFRAQFLIALCNAALFALGFWIIGLPMGIVLGIFVGLLNMVPYLQNIGIIPAAFLALLQSLQTGQSFWLLLLFVLIIFIVVGLIEQAVLTPRIMGKATGLHPAFILLALSVWGSILGLLGLIIAMPMTTVLLSYYRRFLLPEWLSLSGEELPDKMRERERVSDVSEISETSDDLKPFE